MLRIAQPFGIIYLPLLVVRERELLAQAAVAAGLVPPKLEFVQLSGGPTTNGALIAGSVDVASAGIPPVLTLWARSRNSFQARAIAPLGGMPYELTTRNPAVRTIADFTDRDRIAVPAVRVSFQSVVLQMHAEQAFGPGQQDRLEALLRDPQTPFSTTPRNVVTFASFMARTGQLPVAPTDWKDLLFPELYSRAGS